MRKRFILFLFPLIFMLIDCGGVRTDSTLEVNDSSKQIPIVAATRDVVHVPDCPSFNSPIPFITELVSYKIGPGGGFNWKSLPQVILGPPHGTNILKGSYDVFSLGQGGEIVVKMGVPILDGEGVDFIVFENAFYAEGNPKKPYAEPGEVSVSRDGIHFKTFPCQGGNWKEFYPGCAGLNPVFANPDYNKIDSTDPKSAGGDSFDLKEVGLNCVQYIKIKDATPPEDIDTTLSSQLDDVSNKEGDVGFDLDAISAVYY